MAEDGFVDGVRVAVDDRGVARIEIHRPDRMNALDPAAAAAIVAAADALAARPEVRVVVIDGRGGSFSTGADIVGIGAEAAASADPGAPDAAPEVGAEQARSIIEVGSELVRAVRRLTVPVIAAVDGPAVGVGASLAMVADLIFVTRRTYFLLPFVSIGLMPDGGATVSVTAALGRVRANALALLGDRLAAEDAFAAGLVTRVVDDRDALDEAVEATAGKLIGSSAHALRLTKAAIDDHAMAGFEAGLERELAGQTELLQSDTFRAAIAAFAARGR